jgi:hypothetical protein
MTTKMAMRVIAGILLLVGSSSVVLRSSGQSVPPSCTTTGIAGPLRVSSVNRRYFINDCGNAIYLTGSHTWNNFPDMDDTYPPENQPFDYSHYLDFLDQYNHNFVRLWAWEGPFPDNADRYPRRVWAGPQPWLRTGPGNDVTGHPRFDLTRWNQAYFDRLRQRVAAAQSRGIFVSIMLFEGWELQFAPGASSHPFSGSNNINGIDDGGSLTNIHTLQVPAITALQEEYVRRVIDSVNDLDNVLYEICNEAGTYSTSWQYHMIQFIKQYEAGKPKQHPVGMTAQYPNGSHSTLMNSAAEWVSPGPTSDYLSDPPVNNGAKITVNDTDHLGGSSVGDRQWAWKSFTRGLHTLFMDRYEPPDSIADAPLPNAVQIRRAMGDTQTYAERINLLATTPSTSISSTRYALANSQEVLVYNPSASSFTVDLTAYSGTLQVEWFNTVTRQTISSPSVSGGASRSFQPPFSEAVLYLRLTSGTSVPGPPSAPGAPSATPVSSSQIDLTWGPATDDGGVVGYRVERCTGAGCTTFGQVATPAGTSYSDTGLSSSTSYTYRVRAVDAANNVGPYSASATAVTPASGSGALGLVAAYGFDEGSGSGVNDASGNGNSGTTTNAVWTTAGKFGGALVFNGESSRVTIGDSPSLRLTSAMTLEAWVFPTQSNSQWRDVIYKGNDNYYLEATSTNGGVPGAGGTFLDDPLYGPVSLPLNTWSHLAVTYDRTVLRLYVNGTQVASVTASAPLATSANPLQIGGDAIYGQHFAGRIDEVRIFSVARTATQIAADMNAAVNAGM